MAPKKSARPRIQAHEEPKKKEKKSITSRSKIYFYYIYIYAFFIFQNLRYRHPKSVNLPSKSNIFTITR